MVVRITKTDSQDRTVLKVDGLLQAADVETLNHEWQTARWRIRKNIYLTSR